MAISGKEMGILCNWSKCVGLHLPSFHFITVPLQPAWHWLLNLVII
jgi:hypothetical protein